MLEHFCHFVALAALSISFDKLPFNCVLTCLYIQRRDYMILSLILIKKLISRICSFGIMKLNEIWSTYRNNRGSGRLYVNKISLNSDFYFFMRNSWGQISQYIDWFSWLTKDCVYLRIYLYVCIVIWVDMQGILVSTEKCDFMW